MLERVGASIHSSQQVEPSELLELVSEKGINHIKWKFDAPVFLETLFEDSAASELKDTLSSYDITYSVHAPYLNLNLSSINPAIRKASVETITRSLELASDIGAELVSVHTGRLSKDLPKSYLGAAIDNCVRSLRRLEEEAEGEGIELGVENDHKTSDYLVSGYPEQVEQITDQVGCGFVFDVGHANTLTEPEHFVRRLGGRISEVHLHDNYGRADTHLAVGEGNIQFRRTFRLLNEAGFEGRLILETRQLEQIEIGYDRLKFITKYVE